jgi:hypothetical protein
MINDAGKYEVKNSRAPPRAYGKGRRDRWPRHPGARTPADTPPSGCPGARPARSNKETTVLGKNINVLSWGGAETER